jgi:hypothetical protein
MAIRSQEEARIMPGVWRGHQIRFPEPALIRVCVNADEKEAIRRYCRARGWTYSQLLRVLVLNHIAREEGREAAYSLTQEVPAP